MTTLLQDLRYAARRLRSSPDAPGVAVVNEAAARALWPGQDPVGRAVWMGPPEHLIAERVPPGYRFPRLTVVGVVGNEKVAGLDQPPVPEVYQPFRQTAEGHLARYLLVRTAGDPSRLLPALREQVRAIDSNQPVARAATLEALLAESLVQRRFGALLLGLFAGLAAALAGIGIYGVISFTTSQREREIGVRMALGAGRRQVVAMVVLQALIPTGAGIAIGLAAAWGLGGALRSLLFGVAASDPAVLAAVALFLAAVALLAASLPARRAAGLPPTLALRSE